MQNNIFKIDKLKLNKVEKRVVNDYIDDSVFINSYLRNDSEEMDYMSKKEKEKIKKESRILNNLIKKSPRTTGKVIIWRGQDFNSKNLKIGDEISLLSKGIVSTSLDKKIALNFFHSKCCLFRIVLPKNSKALYINEEEKEVILPHRSIFIFERKLYDDNLKKWIIYVTHVGNHRFQMNYV